MDISSSYKSAHFSSSLLEEHPKLYSITHLAYFRQFCFVIALQDYCKWLHGYFFIAKSIHFQKNDSCRPG